MIRLNFKKVIFFTYLSLYLTPIHASPSIVIDINSPIFRKLSTAVPPFIETIDAGEKKDQTVASNARVELVQLLELTGMFQIMREVAYKGIPLNSASKLSPVPGFEGTDILQWKAIGAELLIVGYANTQKGKHSLEFRAADVKQGIKIISKAYTLNSRNTINFVVKDFINLLLETYTGKPGIFTKFVFAGRRHKDDRNKQIFTCDIDGKNVEQITHTPAAHLSPSWSPDGTKIVYTSYESGNPDLYLYDLVTKKHQVLAKDKGINSGGTFSPNGKLVVYSGTTRADTDLFAVNHVTKQKYPLIRGNGVDVDPEFSPDEKYLVYVSGRYGNPHIFRAELEWDATKELVRVKTDKRLTFAGWFNATPAWSPDSSKIAFAGFDRDIKRFDIFLMNFDGSKLERLTLASADNENPSWSPNGQLMVFHSNRVGQTNEKGVAQLFLMNKDGSDQRLISTGLYEAKDPNWQQR